MTSFTDATIPSNPNQPEEADCSQKDESSNMRLLGDLKANEYFTSRRLGRKRTQTKLYSPLVTDKRLRSQSEASNKQDAVQSEIEGKKKISHFSLPKREVIFDVFERFDTLCKKSLQVDNKKQDKIFADWQSSLLAGFNILCYGFGSKLNILKEFADNYILECFVLQIHGYLKSVSVQYVCKFILEKIMNFKSIITNSSLEQTCHDIVKLQNSSSYPRTILIVHSLDGYALRSLELQRCLSILSTAKLIHVLASIDHINSPCMWLESDLERYQWVYYQLDSDSPYDHEIMWQSSTSQKETKQSSAGIQYIIQSLAPKDVSILRCIARIQLIAATSTTRSTRVFAEYHKVYGAATKELLVRSYGAFGCSIKTLKDHGLVRHRQMRGIERLEIPFDAHVVEDILYSPAMGNNWHGK
ncbi:hypothetical protein ABG067_002831 [Albugo candida]